MACLLHRSRNSPRRGALAPPFSILRSAKCVLMSELTGMVERYLPVHPHRFRRPDKPRNILQQGGPGADVALSGLSHPVRRRKPLAHDLDSNGQTELPILADAWRKDRRTTLPPPGFCQHPRCEQCRPSQLPSCRSWICRLAYASPNATLASHGNQDRRPSARTHAPATG
jgi:hypothetical protein